MPELVGGVKSLSHYLMSRACTKHCSVGEIWAMKVKELCSLKRREEEKSHHTGLGDTKAMGICYILTTASNLSFSKRDVCLISEQAILESACA